MTGPEHYLQAEKLLQEAFAVGPPKPGPYPRPADPMLSANERMIRIRAAGVHTQLAHAAAVALIGPNTDDSVDVDEWIVAAGAADRQAPIPGGRR